MQMIKPLMLPLIAMTLTLPAQAADQLTKPQVVDVIMIDNRFEPDHLTFRQGRAYQLHLENKGKEMHEFTAPAFLKASVIKNKGLLANGGTDIVVQPGKSVNFVFVAPAKGNYELTCADHDWDGMVGSITVD